VNDYHSPCRVLRAAHDSGIRRASDIDLIVLHSTEGGTAESVALMFSHASARASTQLVVDDEDCYRMLPDLVIPWAAPGANSDGLHIELCGFARWERAIWRGHEPMLKRAAFKAAKWCWQYKIPRRWLTVSELKTDKRGFTTHADVNAAFKRSDHWDPGDGFPRPYFLDLVKHSYKQIVEERTRS
jgi:hypothetical protein